MFSFFKNKVPLTQYCNTMLNTIFCEEMTGHFLRLKTGIPDPALSKVEQHLFLNELRGAHLQLFQIAIAKQRQDFKTATEMSMNDFEMGVEMSMEMTKCINLYLTRMDALDLQEVSREYNQAFGSSHSDGILEMAKLFSIRLTNNELSQDVAHGFRDLFYGFLSSVFNDLKKVKIK